MAYFHAENMTILLAVGVALCVLSVGLRVIVRVTTKNAMLTDDWLVIAALITFLAFAGCAFEQLQVKMLGYSTFDFAPEVLAKSIPEAWKVEFAMNAAVILSFGCIKASALFFYRRIFCVPGSGNLVFSRLTIATLVVVVCWVIAFEIIAGEQCHGHWKDLQDPAVFAKHCTISWPFWYSTSISNVLLDAWIIFLPVPKILGLHASIARRISVIGVMLLALVGLGASIARMAVFTQFGVEGLPTKQINPEYLLSKYYFFTTLEAAMCLVAVNLPSLYPIFVKMNAETVTRVAKRVSSLTSLSSLRARSLRSWRSSDRDEPVELLRYGVTGAWEGDCDLPALPPLPYRIYREDLYGTAVDRGGLGLV